jgi:hypothetical protein
MRLSTSIAALLVAEQCLSGSSFSPQQNSISRQTSSLRVSAETAPEEKKLTSADILARARKAAGVPEEEIEEEGPTLFNDDLLNDMQQSLLILEKRVKEGPGTVSLLELEELQAMTERIVKDMKDKEDGRLNELANSSTPAETLKAEAPLTLEAAPAPEAAAPAAPGGEEAEEIVITDTSLDEGPKYEGEGGMGLAKGTTNTWVIPGMDEMSPEEYQKALQDSISARQAGRKDRLPGVYGNRQTNDYLANLSPSGPENEGFYKN